MGDDAACLFALAQSYDTSHLVGCHLKYGKPRIADLQRTPAEVRFLSIEPLLEDLDELDLSNIDWAIVGGESGPGARGL